VKGLAQSALRAAGTATLAVLTAFGCSFDGSAPVLPPTANDFFVGCFEGAISRGANIGELTLVLIRTPGTEFGLDGCVDFTLAPTVDVLTITGSVDGDDHERAGLEGRLGGGGFLRLELTRNPVGDLDATSLALAVPTGTFEAASLLRCNPEVEFGDLCPAALYLPSTQGDVP
jgi:hypothetical protein